MSTATKLKAVWIEYPTGNRAYGGGGWSRRAKHRPAPERRELITTDVITTTGKSVIIAGQRKLKVNLFVAATGEVIRADYPLNDELTEFGLSTRQIAARRRVAAAKAAKAEAASLDAIAEKDAALASKLESNPGAVAAWIAGGCVHPCPSEIMAAKKASGLHWSEFEKGASL